MRLTTPPAGWRTIAAVPCRYRGVLFRSILEADWATTLDALHIEWQYEPQAVRLRSGVNYLPDFYLPAIGTWIEVKGPGVPGARKAFELADSVRCSCFGVDLTRDPRPDRPDTSAWYLGGDLCECDWRGGEFVIIGLPSTGGIETRSGRFGFAAWVSPLGIDLKLTICKNCRYWSWICDALPTCRRCGDPVPIEDGFASGEFPFSRTDKRRVRRLSEAISDLFS